MSAPRPSRRLSQRGLGLLLALLAGTAAAYVLPADAILRRLADARDELRLTNLTVQGTLLFPAEARSDEAREGGRQPVEGRILMRVPGRCRFELLSEGKPTAFAVHAAGALRAEDAPEAVQVALSQLCPLLASRTVSRQSALGTLSRHLSSLGVDTSQTSLGRVGGAVAYVIGQQREGAPQLWVYQESFLPARVRFTQGEAAWDVRLLDYASPATGERFPRRLEVHRDGVAMLTFTASSSDSSTRIDEALF